MPQARVNQIAVARVGTVVGRSVTLSVCPYLDVEAGIREPSFEGRCPSAVTLDDRDLGRSRSSQRHNGLPPEQEEEERSEERASALLS